MMVSNKHLKMGTFYYLTFLYHAFFANSPMYLSSHLGIGRGGVPLSIP